MARRQLIAGNWKMNLQRADAVALAAAVVEAAKQFPDVDVALCPPSVYLDPVAQVVRGTSVGLGAQNMYHEKSGAFTGEISAAMLLDVGCKYVILGHSERRHILGESDAAINLKVLAALAAGLTPILCVGEKLEERQSGRTHDVIRSQIEGSLAGLSPEQMAQCVVAYEPVWAIGTGLNATPEQAEEVHVGIRKLLETRYNKQVADGVRIQYGGSVSPKNAAQLLAQPNIDGGLVGGASLKIDLFQPIIAARKA